MKLMRKMITVYITVAYRQGSDVGWAQRVWGLTYISGFPGAEPDEGSGHSGTKPQNHTYTVCS